MGCEKGQSCKWRNLTRRHLLCPSECLRSSPWFFIRSPPVPWCRLLAVSVTRVWIYEFFSCERELVSEWLPALGSSPTIPPYTHTPSWSSARSCDADKVTMLKGHVGTCWCSEKLSFETNVLSAGLSFCPRCLLPARLSFFCTYLFLIGLVYKQKYIFEWQLLLHYFHFFLFSYISAYLFSLYQLIYLSFPHYLCYCFYCVPSFIPFLSIL